MVQRKFDAMHEFIGSWSAFVRNTVATKSTTIFPIVMNDDAQGDPMNFKAHPEHASWAEIDKPNCFPDSEIRRMRVSVEIIVPKAVALITSRIKVEYALISCAFPEDLDALDEKSGLTLKEVLEIQKETTDRQTYPLYNTVKMGNGSTLHAQVPGLTASQVIEGVSFSSEILKDQARYGRIKGLIRKCLPIGYRTTFVKMQTVAGGRKKLTFNFTPSNAKFINPYTFLGLMIHIPGTISIGLLDPTLHQSINQADVTADTEFVIVTVHVQYNERNPEFHMGKV